MASTHTTALTVVYPPTSEVIDVRAAADERLAEFVEQIGDLRSQLAEAAAIVGDELVRRMDMDGKWTRRVGDPATAQWEIKSPSPAAGTETFPALPLEDVLYDLIGTETISPAAAGQALRRTVSVELVVPFGSAVGLEDLLDMLVAAPNLDIAGSVVTISKATADRKVMAGGVAALRKIPAARAAIDEVAETVDPPARRATVKRKARA